MDLLGCKICGGKYKMLLRHVSGKHKDITIEEYKKLDPRDRYTSESTHKLCSDNISNRNKENWKDPEYREKMIEYHSNELKNRWRTDENFRHNVTESARKRSDDLHDRMWNGTDRKYGPDNNLTYREYMSEVFTDVINDLWASDEIGYGEDGDLTFREMRSEESSKTIKRLMDEGKITYEMCLDNARSNKITKYKGIIYRSSWEVLFVQYLESMDIEFYYEIKGFDYEHEGKMRKYYPDFYLPEYDLL